MNFGNYLGEMWHVWKEVEVLGKSGEKMKMLRKGWLVSEIRERMIDKE